MKPFSLSALLLLIQMPAHANLINKRDYNMFLLGRVVGATELACREKVGIDKAKFYKDSKKVFKEIKAVLPDAIVNRAWQDLRTNCKTIGGVDIGNLSIKP